MIVKSRLKLGSKLTARGSLSVCRPQIQLYTEKLLGCQNGSKANISKLKERIKALFPVKFQNQSLEFKDIEIDAVGDGGAAGETVETCPAFAVSDFKASVKLEWFCYGKVFGILYVQQRKSIVVPLVRFPKLLASDTLRINEIEKVLVSQLSRQPGIRIEADENSVDISFLKKNATMFQIKADRRMCYAICEGRKVELLRALMALGVTRSHILKVLHDVKTVAYTNGE